MYKKATFSLFGAAVLASAPVTSHAAELLINGSFEGPVVAANQNNLGTAPTSWAVQTSAGASNTANSNLTRGTVTTGTGNTGSNNLAVDPYDTSTGGQQSLDISGAGQAVQTFTAQYSAPVSVKFDLGGRDSTSASASTAGSYWSIYNNATNALVATDSASPLKPGFGAWITNRTTTTASLTANTVYRFVVTVDDPDQLDGLSITQVPEPTTMAATSLGLGLLGWLGYKRRRQS